MAKQSLRKRLGPLPKNDSLATISWMVRALGEMADDVLESGLSTDEKRAEILKIADRMSKLRDTDRIYQAEQVVLGAQRKQEETRPGPAMVDAPQVHSGGDTVTARRGRPPKRSLL